MCVISFKRCGGLTQSLGPLSMTYSCDVLWVVYLSHAKFLPLLWLHSGDTLHICIAHMLSVSRIIGEIETECGSDMVSFSGN